MQISERAVARNQEWRVVKITEVNPSSMHFAAQDQYGTPILLTLMGGIIQEIPAVGEQWYVSRQGSDWRLENRLETTDTDLPITSLKPGDVRIETSGTIYMTSKKSSSLYGSAIYGSGDYAEFPIRISGSTEIIGRLQVTGGIIDPNITSINVKAYGAVGDGVTDDTAAIQTAAIASKGGNVLYFPSGDYKITSSISVPAGTSIMGDGISTNLRPNGCDGLHLVGPINFIGPYFIRDLAIQGTGGTNFAGIRVDGALVSGDGVHGYVFSNLYISGFGYGMFLRNLWRSSIYGVRMLNVYHGIYLKGQNAVLNFDGIVCEKGTPPGTPTGATNPTGFYCNAATDYNPGGNTILRPESIRVNNSQFIGFDIGVDHQQCLVAHYSGLDLDYSAVYGIRYNQSSGGLTFQGDWIAMNGSGAIAGIYAQDVGVGVSKSAVEIDGFHITNYNVSAGSVGIHIGDRQNNVAIRSCYIGPEQGGSDFQTADIQATGVVNGSSAISVTDTICGSTTPTNSIVVGGASAIVTGRGRNLTLAKGISIGVASLGKFVLDSTVTASAMSGGPPPTPNDGDIWIATAVDANGTVWQFRYNAGSASAYKWEFIGGSKMNAVLASPGSTTSLYTTYVDLTGPSVTVARAGDYLVGYAADAYNNTAGGGAIMNVCSTNVAEIDNNMTYTGASVAGTVPNVGAICKEVLLPGVQAGDVIKCRYCSLSSGTSTYERAQILVQPVRVS